MSRGNLNWDTLNWDDAKYFLAVAREGQMLGAANRLGVSQAKLSRRIASLEKAFDAQLVRRSTSGCELTEDGVGLLATCERIEQEFREATSRIREPESGVSGTVRIGTPDGFGITFLAPRIRGLIDQYPELRVQLVPIPRSFSLSQREADIAVMVGRPENGRLRARKLTDYSLSLYASSDYVKENGKPTTLEELNEHKLVGYVDDLIFSPALNFNAEISRNWTSSLEISSAVGQFEAVRSGVGIGVLHDFMAFSDPDFIRLLPEISLTRAYWSVWHESMKNTRRVRVVAEYLDQIVKEKSVRFTLPVATMIET